MRSQSGSNGDNMSHKIVSLTVRDVRFPTSEEHHGSDAMVRIGLIIRDFISGTMTTDHPGVQHADPDYSAAYVVLDADSGLKGFGITFTLGRGTDIGKAHAPSSRLRSLQLIAGRVT